MSEEATLARRLADELRSYSDLMRAKGMQIENGQTRIALFSASSNLDAEHDRLLNVARELEMAT